MKLGSTISPQRWSKIPLAPNKFRIQPSVKYRNGHDFLCERGSFSRTPVNEGENISAVKYSETIKKI